MKSCRGSKQSRREKSRNPASDKSDVKQLSSVSKSGKAGNGHLKLESSNKSGYGASQIKIITMHENPKNRAEINVKIILLYG